VEVQAILDIRRGSFTEETPEQEFIGLLCKLVKFSSLGIIGTFGVIRQTQERMVLAGENPCRQSLRIMDRERTNDD
jgi:hypothetical protein